MNKLETVPTSLARAMLEYDYKVSEDFRVGLPPKLYNAAKEEGFELSNFFELKPIPVQ